MGVLKVIELMANSSESWEDAIRNAVTETAKTVKNIRSVYVKEQSATVDGNNVTEFRATVKITFEVN